MKSGDKERVGVLRMLAAALNNEQIELRSKGGGGEALSDEVSLAVLQKEAKKRKDAIDAYEQGGRPELAERERFELDIIAAYLPEQLSEEEIRALVRSVMEKTGASDEKSFGMVMGGVMKEAKGRADGNMVSQIVKDELNNRV